MSLTLPQKLFYNASLFPWPKQRKHTLKPGIKITKYGARKNRFFNTNSVSLKSEGLPNNSIRKFAMKKNLIPG